MSEYSAYRMIDIMSDEAGALREAVENIQAGDIKTTDIIEQLNHSAEEFDYASKWFSELVEQS